MFIWVWFLSRVPSVILNHIYDIGSESLLGTFDTYWLFCSYCNSVVLAVGFCHILSWVTIWAIDVSNHLHSTLAFPFPRLSWGSSRGSVNFSGVLNVWVVEDIWSLPKISRGCRWSVLYCKGGGARYGKGSAEFEPWEFIAERSYESTLLSRQFGLKSLPELVISFS
jgi:hypothetical protein